ncbi:prepilin-type N-terminal cleavage/methylation domain-containing protein [Candidatus Poribacteria bacterium]|nr:prepilin-type N-terminal cleavage/methylation domain-containing protein [Candidatus Poribacteria bacterium]
MPRVLGDKRGFTLTELLVVVAIIVLLVSIVVPNIAGRLTTARMHSVEDQIAEIEAALAAYHADFGTYPGDVWPTEDKNNDGVLTNEDVDDDDVLDATEDLNNNGALDNEDIGVDVDRDGISDYACSSTGGHAHNGRLDHGDGVINILDLEWALKTTAKNGPYMEDIPLDAWDNKYVYYAPMDRPQGTAADQDFLWINPSEVGDLITTEDANGNGRLDTGEDTGIADYDVNTALNPNVRTNATSFLDMSAGAGNGVLDRGDDDNGNGTIERYNITTASPVVLEYGNKDVSPDGLARNAGYYVYSVGRNRKDETAIGYEDINRNDQLDGSITTDSGAFDEDSISNDDTLDTGYEDTGLDGIPGTKDNGEDDGKLTIGTDSPPVSSEDFDGDNELDIGGDDMNSWNKKQPWREHKSYGG